MEEEREAMETNMENIEIRNILNLNFYIGKIGNKKCVMVQSGVGKVNASRATQILIDNFKVTHIINIGAAASLNEMLDIGDVVIGKYVVQHDFDITAFGHSKGYITGVGNGVECDNQIIEAIQNAIKNSKNNDYKSKIGVVATGDIFCTEVAMKDKISAKFDADVVDMECGAVAQVAYLSNIPFGVIRSVSDKPNGKNEVDFDNNLRKASVRCSEVLAEAIRSL